MTDVFHELIDALSETPRRLEALAQGAPGDLPRSNEAWGPAEVAAHLADVDRLYRSRMQTMLTQQTPVLRRFNPDATAREHDYAARSLADALADFAQERGETISLLMNLALKDWDRSGILDPIGELTIEDLVERMIAHDAAHLEQAEAALGA